MVDKFKYPYLFLDDIRNPADVNLYQIDPIYQSNIWHVVRSYDEFINCIEGRGLPSLISLDHDLGLDMNNYIEAPSGYDAAKWLVDYIIDNELRVPIVLSHSQNPVGNKNIITLFDNFKRHYNNR